jgi:type IV pilus assembly protein PilN
MIKINLLPVPEKVREADIRRQVSLGIIVILAVLLIMGLFEMQNRLRLYELRSENENLSQTLAELKREVGDLSKLEREKEDLERRKDTILKLTQNLLGTVMVLDKLVDAKPDSIYFMSLEQKNPGAPWEEFGLVLKGVALDNEIVAQFMRNLQANPLFTVVDLDYTKSSKVKSLGLTFQEFQLSLQIAQPQEPIPETDTGEREKKQG